MLLTSSGSKYAEGRQDSQESTQVIRNATRFKVSADSQNLFLYTPSTLFQKTLPTHHEGASYDSVPTLFRRFV